MRSFYALSYALHNTNLVDLTICKPQIRPNLSNTLELFLRILGAHARRHDNVFPNLPINRRGDALPITSLQTIDHAEDLARVPPRRRRIHHRQADLLGRIDHEDATDRECDALLVDVLQVLLVHHVVQPGDLAVRVRDDGELQLGVADVVDVLDPAVVAGEVVG